jgi:hypothetical protein
MSTGRKTAAWVVLACMGLGLSPVLAAPPGYAVCEPYGADGGVAALAYGSDGNLYLAEAGSSTLTVVSPGGVRQSLPIVGAALVSVGGMWVTPDNSALLITDNKAWSDGQGDLYAVDVLTGHAQTLISGLDFIDDVAVRATGEIFVTEPVGVGDGAVLQLTCAGQTWSAVPVVTGLDYVAGLAFDPAGNLIYQQATASFVGEVYRLGITGSAGALSFGSPELLASGLSAAFDLAVDSDGDVFVTGSGGLFELGRDGAGGFTGAADLFDSDGSPYQFATEVTFLTGQDAFEPFAGLDGGRIAYVPEYSSPSLREITPVPAPAPLAMLLFGALVPIARRPGRRRREGQALTLPAGPGSGGPAGVEMEGAGT